MVLISISLMLDPMASDTLQLEACHSSMRAAQCVGEIMLSNAIYLDICVTTTRQQWVTLSCPVHRDILFNSLVDLSPPGSPLKMLANSSMQHRGQTSIRNAQAFFPDITCNSTLRLSGCTIRPAFPGVMPVLKDSSLLRLASPVLFAKFLLSAASCSTLMRVVASAA
jgi:hypothetical protein